VTAPIPLGAYERRRELAVWRATLTDDGAGGQTATLVQVATVHALVSQPTAAEQMVADQSGATLTHIIHLGPEDDVRRGDELADDGGEVFRVISTVMPSEAVYLRANCERRQAEPVEAGS